MDIFGWISQQDASALVIAIGLLAASLTAVVTAVRLPIISKPGRWIWRRLIGEPVTAWVNRTLDAWSERPDGVVQRLDRLEAQHHRNGGSSTRDRIEAIAQTVRAPPPP